MDHCREDIVFTLLFLDSCMSLSGVDITGATNCFVKVRRIRHQTSHDHTLDGTIHEH
jgi:hypothetical protein